MKPKFVYRKKPKEAKPLFTYSSKPNVDDFEQVKAEIIKQWWFVKNVPLSIGIIKQLFELYPRLNVGRIRLRKLFNRHCRAPVYLRKLARYKKRYNALGQLEGVVTPEQQELAKTRLAAIYKHIEERKNARSV